jgi:hypothetical protein
VPNVSEPERFTRALTVYFGDASSPGYDPVAALGARDRLAVAFPEAGARVRQEIDEMFESALSLPGLSPLALDDASRAIRAFVAGEYAFLPPILQVKVVNCCCYRLWK